MLTTARVTVFRAMSSSFSTQKRCQHSVEVVQAFASCQDTVQKHDFETLVWLRGLDANLRAPLTMLRALNVETSSIGDLVTKGGEPLRRMRFQWWKDAVNKVYAGERIDHPVLIALQHSLAVAPLSKYRIQRIIDAKAEDQASGRSYGSIHDLETFCEATQSNLLYLQLEAAGVASTDADHAASHLGKAVGLANLLRGARHFLQRGINYFPTDLCAQHAISTEALFRGEGLHSDAVRDVVYLIASCAHGHLEQSALLHGKGEKVPRTARKVFLSSVACRLFLTALQKSNFALFGSHMAHGGFTPLWYMLNVKYEQLRL